MDNIVNKHALITGATSGIGYELAKVFAENHYNLIIVARNQEELSLTASQLTQQYGVSVVPVAKDLFERNAAFELYDEVKSTGLQVDVLVNDAAQGQFGLFVDTDIQRDLDIIQLNVASFTALTKLFLKDMVVRNEGKILQIASIAGKVPGPYQAVYHATKAYVLSLTEAIHNELKGSNVTITALLPGATDTDFFRKADGEDSTIVQETTLADPAEVARDGYDALMRGDMRYISGAKNKMQMAMANVMPDKMVAENMRKQNEPSQK